MPGRLDDAIAEYKNALRLNADYAPAWRNLGAALFNQGNTPRAIEAFQRALILLPGSADAHYVLGLALLRLPGRTDDAVAQLEEALRLAPGYPPAQAALSEVLGRAR
jgi:superkiller protein 3